MTWDEDALGSSTPRGVVLGVAVPPRGAAALELAVDLARSRSCPLSLVRTWEPSPTDRELGHLEQAERALVQDVAERARSLAPGLDLATHLLRGRAEDVLVRSSRQADLLVVTAPADRVHRTGRVLRHVTAQAACPVVVTPDRQQRSRDLVVVGVDPDGGSGPAVDHAFDQASRWGTGLLAVLAVESGYEGFLAEALVEQATRAGRRHLSESLAGRRERWPDVAVQELVAFDDPAHALQRAAGGARLLVVGRHDRHGLSRLLLGSVSTVVLHRPPCPVAVVRCPAPVPRQRTDRPLRPAALPGPLL